MGKVLPRVVQKKKRKSTICFNQTSSPTVEAPGAARGAEFIVLPVPVSRLGGDEARSNKGRIVVVEFSWELIWPFYRQFTEQPEPVGGGGHYRKIMAD